MVRLELFNKRITVAVTSIVNAEMGVGKTMKLFSKPDLLNGEIMKAFP